MEVMIFGVRMLWVMVTASIDLTIGRGTVLTIIIMAISVTLSIAIATVLSIFVIIMVRPISMSVVLLSWLMIVHWMRLVVRLNTWIDRLCSSGGWLWHG